MIQKYSYNLNFKILMEKEPGDSNSKKKLENDEDDLVLQEGDMA